MFYYHIGIFFTLTGRYLAVRGNSSRNEFGVTLVARSAWRPGDDIVQRIDSILERIEGKGAV